MINYSTMIALAVLISILSLFTGMYFGMLIKDWCDNHPYKEFEK